MSHLFAYVDPGTGSVIIQAIIGGVAGVSYAVRHRIKGLIARFTKRKNTEDKGSKSEYSSKS